MSEETELLTDRTQEYLPVAPLQNLVDRIMTERNRYFGAEDDTNLETLIGKTLAARYYRGLSSGRVQILAADEIACGLGMHPTEIWGEAWWNPSYEPHPPRKDRCKWGHPMAGNNVLIRQRRGRPNPTRRCRACANGRPPEL